MTQDERWLVKYNEVMAFIKREHRNPSKFIPDELGLRNWVRHQQKLVNKGELKEERVGMYKELCNKQTFFVLFFVKLFVHFARQFSGSFVPAYC